MPNYAMWLASMSVSGLNLQLEKGVIKPEVMVASENAPEAEKVSYMRK